MGARIDLGKVPVLPVFKWLADAGGIAQEEMLRTFNCGVGMVVIAAAGDADKVVQTFTQEGEQAVVIGEVVRADDETRVVYDGQLDLSWR